MSRYKFIMLGCGYVETNMTSVIIYGCEFMGHSGFATQQEAITELALDLYAKFYDEKFYDERLSLYENRYSRDVKKCCRDALIEKRDANFCSVCGLSLKSKEFDETEFLNFVKELHCTDCDSYGEAETANDREFAWWPFSPDSLLGSPRESVVFLGEKAEYVLLCALYDANPELRNQVFDVYETVNTFGLPDWERFKTSE